MSPIIRSLHRDYRDVERLLRVLEHECDAFYHAERPDYQLLGELIEHLDVFSHRYLLPRQDLSFKRVSRSDAGCAKIIDDIVNSRTKASASLKVLSRALLDILNEQCVSRPTFDDVAGTSLGRRGIRSSWRSSELPDSSIRVVDCRLG